MEDREIQSAFTKTYLTHWGRVTQICVSKLTIIGSDNGLSPRRHQAIIWTNAGILLIGPLGTNLSEISIKIYALSFKEMAAILSWPQCVKVLTQIWFFPGDFLVHTGLIFTSLQSVLTSLKENLLVYKLWTALILQTVGPCLVYGMILIMCIISL